MTRRETIFGLTLIAVFSFTGILESQGASPLFGTWRQNFEKSSPSPDRPYKRVELKIEPWQDDGLKAIYDMVGTRGGVTHIEWSGRLDGKDYAVHGVETVLTNAYTRIDQSTYRIVIKIDGAVAAIAEVTVSADGKSLTTVTTEKRAKGPDASTTAVYERR